MREKDKMDDRRGLMPMALPLQIIAIILDGCLNGNVNTRELEDTGEK